MPIVRSPVSVVAQVGRGASYPLRFDGGETVVNVPASPTLKEAEAAAVSAMRAVVPAPIGSAFFDRDFGSRASEFIAGTANEATIAAGAASGQDCISRFVDFVENVLIEDADYNDVTGEATFDYVYGFKRSSAVGRGSVGVPRG